MNPISTKAVSVGSPVRVPSFAILVSLQSILASTTASVSTLNVSPFSTSDNLPFVKIFFTVILFCVKVPVLSEQITLALPKVSTAGNFFTIAFLFTILWTPIAKTIVEIAAKPSGIAATAKDTAVINIWIGSFPYKVPTTKIIAHITNATIPKVFPKLFNFIWSGVASSSVSLIISAILPTSVSIPVSTTIPFPLP